jgi:outer membrane protein OmpA-like peptidoglycan-associated protein
VLEEILFHPDSDEFLTEAYPVLAEFLKAMQKYSTLKIEIQGHICCSIEDSDEFTGKPLSISRAEAVYNYLVEKGINSTRMTYKGFGSTRKRFPLEQNEHEMSMNRRVEILILEK